MRWQVCLSALVLTGCVLPRPIERATPADLESPAPPDPGGGIASSVWRTIGTSVEGRPIRVRTVGQGPRRVLWVGGIHGNEREGRVATDALPKTVEATAGLADAITLTIVEDLNPDGSASRKRVNAAGVDLNRNFPATNFLATPSTGERPMDQPEARALHGLLQELRPDLVIVAHSTSGRRFINYDGPARPLAERFAAMSQFPLVESGDLHATPGSLGTWLGRDLGTPILTLEFRRGEDAAAAWADARAAILAVIAGTS